MTRSSYKRILAKQIGVIAYFDIDDVDALVHRVNGSCLKPTLRRRLEECGGGVKVGEIAKRFPNTTKNGLGSGETLYSFSTVEAMFSAYWQNLDPLEIRQIMRGYKHRNKNCCNYPATSGRKRGYGLGLM